MPKVLEYPGSPPRNWFVFYEPEPVRGGAYRLQWPRYRNLVAISDKTGCLRGGEFSPHPFWQSWQLTQTRNDATRLRRCPGHGHNHGHNHVARRSIYIHVWNSLHFF